MEGPTLLCLLLLLPHFLSHVRVGAQTQTPVPPVAPLNCTTPSECTSYFYHPVNVSAANESARDVAGLYNVPVQSLLSVQPNTLPPVPTFIVPLTCQCGALPGGYNNSQSAEVYTSQISYTASSDDVDYSSISNRFDDAVLTPEEPKVSPGSQQVLYLGCGCVPPDMEAQSDYTAVVTYKIVSQDTLFKLSNFFGSNISAIQALNNIAKPDFILADQVIYIPVKNVSSIGGPTVTETPSTNVQKPKHDSSSTLGIALGIASVVIVGSLLLLGTALYFRSKKSDSLLRKAYSDGNVNVTGQSVQSVQSVQSGTQDIESGGIFRGVGSFFGCAPLKRSGTAKNNNVKRSITLPREANIVFDSEKPVVFTYDEVVVATDNFNESKKIGQGAFGLVYFGNMRQQEVAIKQMKATKSREFYAELKVLCKVHHTNLVELIGYSAGHEHLYLVYEFAENGALSDRLHNPLSKGFTPLSWTQRVQIAVDSARGLEYIHEHTKAHYVHRDVKTSNILLDSYFRAKVADFGLAKLVEQSGEGGEGLTTRVVGTFGYLAPEYVRDGHATSKSDAYAFGVVLMELLTGSEAISKSRTGSNEGGNDKRSLISLMLSVLLEKDAFGRFQNIVDPLLNDSYPKDGAYRMAMLSKACVEEDPSMRPDMRQVVLTLSQIMLASIEWEASLAGNSQIFSGLVQGR